MASQPESNSRNAGFYVHDLTDFTEKNSRSFSFYIFYVRISVTKLYGDYWQFKENLCLETVVEVTDGTRMFLFWDDISNTDGTVLFFCCFIFCLFFSFMLMAKKERHISI